MEPQETHEQTRMRLKDIARQALRHLKAAVEELEEVVGNGSAPALANSSDETKVLLAADLARTGKSLQKALDAATPWPPRRRQA